MDRRSGVSVALVVVGSCFFFSLFSFFPLASPTPPPLVQVFGLSLSLSFIHSFILSFSFPISFPLSTSSTHKKNGSEVVCFFKNKFSASSTEFVPSFYRVFTEFLPSWTGLLKRPMAVPGHWIKPLLLFLLNEEEKKSNGKTSGEKRRAAKWPKMDVARPTTGQATLGHLAATLSRPDTWSAFTDAAKPATTH